MKKRAFLLFAVVGLMAAQIVSCGEPTPPTPPSDDTENTEQPEEKPNVNKKNIKITVPIDLCIAEAILAERARGTRKDDK